MNGTKVSKVVVVLSVAKIVQVMVLLFLLSTAVSLASKERDGPLLIRPLMVPSTMAVVRLFSQEMLDLRPWVNWKLSPFEALNTKLKLSTAGLQIP